MISGQASLQKIVRGMVGRLFPAREIAIIGNGKPIKFRIGPFSQCFSLVAGTALLLWLTIATASILLQGFEHSPKPALESQSPTKFDTITELNDSIEHLEQQVTAALGLADMALSDKAQLELYMAERHLSPPNPLSADGLNETVVEHLNLHSDSQHLQTRQIAQLMTALETSMHELNVARATLNALNEENSTLKDVDRINRAKARRTIARLSDAIVLASRGLERQFKQLGLNVDQLKAEITANYSGEGGLAVYLVDQPDESTYFGNNELQLTFDAIDELNINKLVHQHLPIGHPVKRSNRFTSSFGMRRHPINGRHHFHSGADFAAPVGTPIHATGNGVVIFAGWKPAYGRTVVIRHAGGVETWYAHLSKIRVKAHEKVWRNQQIADMGNSGLSTGSHLHYEVRLGGRAVNPIKFIKAEDYVHTQKIQ